ncbi:hypothetical protein G6L25_08050 [Agrobacterium rhizogenes]|nr:hypothetical protein [Rhizobium rhizogenes]
METMTPAEFIISRLGGLTKTARALSTVDKDFPISTVQGWKDRGRIPQEHWPRLIEVGKEIGVDIELSMFLIVPDGAVA